MTRTSEQNERGRQEYTEGSEDPRFRPSVGRLMNKLRTLPQLDDPKAAAFLIDDMMHRHFVFKRQRPQELWYLAKQAVAYWQLVSPPVPGYENGNELQNIFGDSGKTEIGSKIPTTEDAPKREDGLPPESRVYELYLNRTDLKQKVRAVIKKHSFEEHTWRAEKTAYVPACGCGKEFDFIEQWATHVQVRIWRALENAIAGQSAVSDPPVSSDGEG